MAHSTPVNEEQPPHHECGDQHERPGNGHAPRSTPQRRPSGSRFAVTRWFATCSSAERQRQHRDVVLMRQPFCERLRDQRLAARAARRQRAARPSLRSTARDRGRRCRAARDRPRRAAAAARCDRWASSVGLPRWLVSASRSRSAIAVAALSCPDDHPRVELGGIDVIVRHLRQPAAAIQIDAAVADRHPVQPAIVNHRRGERGPDVTRLAGGLREIDHRAVGLIERGAERKR